MLKALLQEIRTAGCLSRAQLAAKLGEPIGLIDEGIEQLKRLGYLAEDSGERCTAGCGRCPYALLCSQNFVKTLSLTAEGQRLTAEH